MAHTPPPEPPEPPVDIDTIQAHHVYLALACALFAASAVFCLLRPQNTLLKYCVDMLRAGWCVAALGYFVRRAEIRYGRRLSRIERAIDSRYDAGYSDGFVDGAAGQQPHLDARRLRTVPSSS